jgi:hypothetical protein
MKPNNPYNYNMPARPEIFSGRVDEIDSIIQDISTAPGDSCALIGGHRSGKTSLLENLILKLEKQNNYSKLIIPVFINIAGSGIRSPKSFFHLTLDSMPASIKEISTTELIRTLDNSSPAPAFADLLALWNRITFEKSGKQIRVILLLDECEHIANEDWATELYPALRYLLIGQSTRDFFKIVMSGGSRFLNKVQEDGSPLRNILKYYTLHPLDLASARQLILNPTNNLPTNLIVREVISQSGCHPFLIQFIMHYLYERGFENLSVADVKALAKTFSQKRNDFQDWIDSLGYPAKEIYKILLKFPFPLSISELKANFVDSTEDFSSSIEALCYHGLISEENFLYHTNGLMFKNWFEEKHSILESDEITQIFNSIKTKIKDITTSTKRNIAIETLKGIEIEVRRGGNANEQKTKKLLDSLLKIAPDAWEVAIDSLSSPTKGISTIIKKVAERAKSEKDS